ncbi:MAG TPA: glutamate-5-semialdehyde dehydrogenase [Tepidisphaeraceae bacterium]|nr:glutamate-5-semialdehyde dehydrogenase [Tepidisphaeraceae bacterium]
MQDLSSYVEDLGRAARQASQQLVTLDGATKVRALRHIAAALRAGEAALLEANAKDIAAAEAGRLDAPLVHRLRLDRKKVAAMADGVEQIAAQTDPVGQTLEGYVRPNGLRIEKRRVPLGVVLFFYESRPNVTSDAAALCLKSGNAVILRGGKEAFHSNQAIVAVVSAALKEAGIDPSAVQLVESTDRALVPLILKLDRHIDLVIPRGGENLIRAVVKDSTIPVLKHFTGNCHIYVDAEVDGMEQTIRDVCVNAKTSYPGGAVCNAVEHLLFHESVARDLLPKVCADLASKGVEIVADDAGRKLYDAATPAAPDDWDAEYLSFKLGVKVVASMDEAIAHINAHGSHHTDAILSSSVRNIEQFVQRVDSASVIVNASTRFADGGEYGLGAEIGISTDKLHARGPMGAADLTTYKWIVTGNGHVR